MTSFLVPKEYLDNYGFFGPFGYEVRRKPLPQTYGFQINVAATYPAEPRITKLEWYPQDTSEPPRS